MSKAFTEWFDREVSTGIRFSDNVTASLGPWSQRREDYIRRVMGAAFEAGHESALTAESERAESLEIALKALLRRDEINTCQHEDTHRGGFIWEICDQCGAKWADDEGWRPEWQDPPEWVAARAALAKVRGETDE